MIRLLKAAAALQVGFFILWGLFLLTSHKNGTTVWLETTPVDPRDLLSGDYIALRYAIENPSDPSCASIIQKMRQDPSAPRRIYSHLRATEKVVQTRFGSKALWEVSECSETPFDSTDSDVWIQGSFDLRGGIDYGIGRYYFSEGRKVFPGSSGQVVAQVNVNSKGEARIEEIVNKLR